jgi:hypothetical protein
LRPATATAPCYSEIQEIFYDQAFVFIEAEPAGCKSWSRLAGMELASSVIKQVYAVTGRCDLIALVESPDLPSLGD